MENMQTYQLCLLNLSNSTTVEIFFDLKIRVLMDHKLINARDKSLPDKEYHTVESWYPSVSIT
ncbi:predicted protein [Botrytis cinerea T4]|uniref:Uncharacterized protein n=1 Tax=Botryotinia fuckeliana (strain T4) TaxID=999810 RepID=G2YH27_BOTF4|nr:predicted protein [Botrytis cinerea T4]